MRDLLWGWRAPGVPGNTKGTRGDTESYKLYEGLAVGWGTLRVLALGTPRKTMNVRAAAPQPGLIPGLVVQSVSEKEGGSGRCQELSEGEGHAPVLWVNC